MHFVLRYRGAGGPTCTGEVRGSQVGGETIDDGRGAFVIQDSKLLGSKSRGFYSVGAPD